MPAAPPPGASPRAPDLQSARKIAGVLVSGCEFPACHYIQGIYTAAARGKRAKKKLAKAGYDPAPDSSPMPWFCAACGRCEDTCPL
jgi:coenzyme F420-reducing hydrogenase delta subunit